MKRITKISESLIENPHALVINNTQISWKTFFLCVFSFGMSETGYFQNEIYKNRSLCSCPDLDMHMTTLPGFVQKLSQNFPNFLHKCCKNKLSVENNKITEINLWGTKMRQFLFLHNNLSNKMPWIEHLHKLRFT